MEIEDQQPKGESRFLSNAVALAAYTLISSAISLIQVKLLTGYLSKESFGLFASLRGFSLLLATLSANGLPYLLVRFLPVHESRKERKAGAWLCVLCFLVSTGLLALSLFVVESMRSVFWQFISEEKLTRELLLWFYATTLGVSLKLVVYGGLSGLRRFTVQVSLEIVYLIFVLAWIFLERSDLTVLMLFEILGTTSLLTALVGIPILFSALFRGTRRGGELGAPAPGTYGREYGVYWLGAIALSIVAIAFTDVDRYFLSQVIALELISLFHLASRITKVAKRLLGVPTIAFQPEVTRLDAEGLRWQAVSFAKLFVKFNAAISVLVALSIAAFSREIIALVSTRDYSPALPLLVLLVLALPLSAVTAPLTTVMKALDQVRAAFYCDLVWAVSYVFFLLVLSVRFGIIGAGVANLLACLAQSLLAVKVSDLVIELRFIYALGARLFLSGAVAFSPVVFLEISFGGSRGGILFLSKVGALLFALFFFKWMVVLLGVFSVPERQTLGSLLEKSGLGGLGRLLGRAG